MNDGIVVLTIGIYTTDNTIGRNYLDIDSHAGKSARDVGDSFRSSG